MEYRIDRKKNMEGFTLLEVVIAICILSVGLLAIALMQTASIKGNATAGEMTEATTWATDQMEKLLSLPYDDDDLEDTDGDGTGGLSDQTAATADHEITRDRYTVYWNVAEDDVITGTKTVNVIAVWTDRDVEKRVALEQIVPNI